MFEMHCSKLQKEERNSISSTEKPSNANTLAPLSSMSEVSTMTALSSIGRKHMVLTLSSQGNITTADLRSIAIMGVRPLTERMRLACRLGLWCAGAHILGRFKQAMSITYCNIEIFQLSRILVEDWRIKKGRPSLGDLYQLSSCCLRRDYRASETPVLDAFFCGSVAAVWGKTAFR